MSCRHLQEARGTDLKGRMLRDCPSSSVHLALITSPVY